VNPDRILLPADPAGDPEVAAVLADLSSAADGSDTPWRPAVATGIGSMPGTDPEAAAAVVAGELPDLPHLVELPDRGAGADLIGRTLGLLVSIVGEVVPSGWRISRRPGRDQRRAVDHLAWDLDAAERHFAGAPWCKVQAAGPWTLAAQLEVPSGNRALTDAGAVDDLTASLAEGLAAQLADLGRRLPGTRFVVQLDEPVLPAVLAGRLPTASGFGTVSAVEPQRAGEVLQRLVDALPTEHVVAHCCAAEPPLGLLRDSGFRALSVDLTAITGGRRGMPAATPTYPAARLDPIGEAVEAGAALLVGLVPSTSPPPGRPDAGLRRWVDPLLQVWDRLGLSRHALATGVVPTPSCGLAGADQAWAEQALRICGELARALQEPPESWGSPTPT
jgi:methionine synthase II (cobalamin-independent)